MAGFFRVLLAVLAGLIVGSAINMGMILIGGRLVSPPAGADVTTIEGLRASIHLFGVRHFVFPFLAHALGTASGAFVAAWVASGRSALAAGIVGSFFLLGGAANVVMLPAPLWFEVVDLLFAYLPSAWLGRELVLRIRRR